MSLSRNSLHEMKVPFGTSPARAQRRRRHGLLPLLCFRPERVVDPHDVAHGLFGIEVVVVAAGLQ